MIQFPIKKIAALPTEITHQKTTHVKRLVKTDEHHKGSIATINYAWLEPGKQLTAHNHPDGEEFYFFLRGIGEMLVGDVWIPIEKGDFVTVPVAYPHSVKNTAENDLTFITIRTLYTA